MLFLSGVWDGHLGHVWSQVVTQAWIWQVLQKMHWSQNISTVDWGKCGYELRWGDIVVELLCCKLNWGEGARGGCGAQGSRLNCECEYDGGGICGIWDRGWDNVTFVRKEFLSGCCKESAHCWDVEGVPMRSVRIAAAACWTCAPLAPWQDGLNKGEYTGDSQRWGCLLK